MKFGSTPIEEAEGAVLAHGGADRRRRVQKGRHRHPRAPDGAGAAGVRASWRRGSSRATSAKTRRRCKLARRLAGANLRCSPPFTGRVNLFAERAGLAVIEAEAIDRVNAIDEGDHRRDVAALSRRRRRRHGRDGQDHPFAIPGPTLEAALAASPTERDRRSALQADADRGGLDDAPRPQALDRGEDLARARGAPGPDRSADRRRRRSSRTRLGRSQRRSAR